MVILDGMEHVDFPPQQRQAVAVDSAVSVIVIAKRTIRTHLFVYVSSRKVSLEPVLWILVLVIVCQAIRLLHLVVLIISGIDDDGRVMSQSGDVCGALFLD